MSDPLEELPDGARKLLVPAEQPEWADPMLATLTAKRFSDLGWIFEPKFDGERCLAFRKGRGVKLLSRNHLRLDNHYRRLPRPSKLRRRATS